MKRKMDSLPTILMLFLAMAIDPVTSNVTSSTPTTETNCTSSFPPFNNGNITLDDSENTTLGATAKITCYTGYDVTNSKITCLHTGNWSTPENCKPKNCTSSFPPLNNGNITLDDSGNTTLGATATITCNTGYDVTSSNITCLRTGNWSTPDNCKPKNCTSSFPPFNNGNITLDDSDNTTLGATATITCNTGYDVTNSNITCLHTGNWSTAENCKPKNCTPSFPPFNNGNITLDDSNNTTLGATAKITCYTGYDVTSSKITCLHTGNWSNPENCKPKNCTSSFPTVDNGNITLDKSDNSTFGATATITCNPGYEVINTTITCLDTGNWSTPENCKFRSARYNETCAIDKQCNTTNAICNKETSTCLCEGDDFYKTSDDTCVKLKDVDFGVMSFGLSNGKSVSSDWILVKWLYDPGKNVGLIDTFVIIATAEKNGSNPIINETKTDGLSLGPDGGVVYKNISSLMPGTNYSIVFFTTYNTIPSAKKLTIYGHTLPSPLPSAHFSNVTEHSFIINWTDEAPPSYSQYNISIKPYVSATCDQVSDDTKCILILNRGNFTSFEFTKLIAGQEYTVEIYTKLAKLLSDESVNKSTYTVPLLPEKIDIPPHGVRNDSFSVIIRKTIILFDNWSLNVTEERDNDSIVYSNVYTSSERNITVTEGLKSGTEYFVIVKTLVPGYESQNSTTLSILTLPSDPATVEVSKTSITTNSFTIQFGKYDKNFDHFSITVCEIDGTSCSFNESVPNSADNKPITDLISGTKYLITLYTVLENGLKSHLPKTTTCSTLSSDPQQVTVSNVHEKNITIDITTEDDRFSHFSVLVCKVGAELSCPDESLRVNKSHSVIPSLTEATSYKLFVFTVNNDNFKSAGNVSHVFTTRPPTPLFGSVQNVDLRWVQLDLSENNFQKREFVIEYKEGNQTLRLNRSEERPKIEDLTPGTSYEFHVYTQNANLTSDGFKTLSFVTRPAAIKNLAVLSVSNNSITITWGPPEEGNVHQYVIDIWCLGPNSNSTLINKTDIISYPNASYTIIGSLDPGTFCGASITTEYREVRGFSTMNLLNMSTSESGPGPVQNVTFIQSSRWINVKWRKPLIRNGIVTKYVVTTELEGKPIITRTLQCSSCNITNSMNLHDIQDKCSSALRCENSTSEDSLQINVPSLHPYRNYIFSITAFTSTEGDSQTYLSSTKEDKPDGPPENLTSILSTSTVISLLWDPPSYDVRNGIITQYTIQYDFIDKSCTNVNNTSTTREIPSNGNSTALNLTHLLPFTNYHIILKASTSVGASDFSKAKTFSTDQSFPERIDYGKVKLTPPTNQSVHIDWETPCKTNGIITNYTIKILNKNEGSEMSPPIMTTETNATSEDIINLLPYRNYSLVIIGNTIKGGINDTNGTTFTTAIGVPKVPEDVSVYAKSSTELTVKWKKPRLYTGPTRYLISIIDQIEPSQLMRQQVIDGFEANTFEFNKLDEFWNYSVSVSSMTDKGNATSDTVFGKTDEDVPRQIGSLALYPQQNISLSRSITVKWTPPSDRNRNGIITKYVVNCANQAKDKACRGNDKISPNLNEYTIENILPGNYTVVVMAATSKGNGTTTEQSTNVPPGAPLKAAETMDQPLMRKSRVQVNNDQTEIAVELPTASFLCNDSNGTPVEWGVIVSQENMAKDKSFNGEKKYFEEKKKTTYRTWFNVEDDDSIAQYIATTSSWNPCTSDLGTRKRRSTNQNTSYIFTVGLDGDCSSSSDKYCNGELKPGRQYMVKSYVCTEKGCTETLYSRPISTAPKSLVIPIVAGLASAVVLIIVVGGSLFVLRRKQKACFSKDDESLNTHTPGEGIHLDKIEPKKKNAFREVQIKLSKFPDAVEKFHKDSDLLFADAYKLLKEKSPNHPMTAAEQQCCRPKNRYTNILPFDHSRVKLRPSDDIEGSDYINANYIPGYTSRREYIATQGPMLATIDDFWRMVWEQNVDTIVMLTKLMEKGRHKCDKYWPDLGEPVFYGDLVVSLQSESNLSDYTIKIFEIKMKEERKMVRHFSYLKWPDMGCPETPELLLEFVKAVKQYGNQEKNKSSTGPKIVHCSAGVGRTGTFIAVDHLLQHIRDHDEVDIFNLVLDMRNHRLNMVQTEDQYIYIHECLKAFITTDEEEEEEEEAVYVNTGFGTDEENIYVNA